jgi:multiple sugar transport system ATP-binding protein
MGIRPEDIGSTRAEQTADSPRLRAHVNVVEPMGSESYVYLTAGGADFVSRADPHKEIHVGGDIEMPLLMEKASFFDPDTEDRIT